MQMNTGLSRYVSIVWIHEAENLNVSIIYNYVMLTYYVLLYS